MLENANFRLALSFLYRLAVVVGVVGLLLHGVTAWAVLPGAFVLFLFSPSQRSK